MTSKQDRNRISFLSSTLHLTPFILCYSVIVCIGWCVNSSSAPFDFPSFRQALFVLTLCFTYPKHYINSPPFFSCLMCLSSCTLLLLNYFHASEHMLYSTHSLCIITLSLSIPTISVISLSSLYLLTSVHTYFIFAMLDVSDRCIMAYTAADHVHWDVDW